MGKTATDVGYEKPEQNRELKKHAATIHCSNALSLLQRKISNALLYHAYKELMLKEEHEITVKQLCRLIGYQGNNHAAIREALKGLISTVIEWNLIDDVTGAENWTASSIIASVSLEGPMCYYAYSPRMKQLLHSPSMFGKIDLVIQSKFRSSYGLALYENCIRYRGLPHTKWFDIELFKKLMGIPAGMYDVFRDFKRRVLDKAVEEVNMYSDLIVESECVREGRKVVRVRFKLKDRSKKTRIGTQPNKSLPANSLKEKLIHVFGFSETQVKQLLIDYSETYIEAKVGVVEASKLFKEGRVQNYAGYLLSAIKKDYQLPKSQQHEVVNLEDAKLELELSELKRQAEGIRQMYLVYRETEIEGVIASLDDITKNDFMQAFQLFAAPAIEAVLKVQRTKYSRETVNDSPQILALLRQFALRELDISLLSIEEFILTLDEKKQEGWRKLKSHDPEYWQNI